MSSQQVNCYIATIVFLIGGIMATINKQTAASYTCITIAMIFLAASIVISHIDKKFKDHE